MKKIIAMLFLFLMFLSGCSTDYKYQRATGDSVGNKCSTAAYSIDKIVLYTTTGDFIYSWFYNEKETPSGFSKYFWDFIGDGKLKARSLQSEIYRYNNKTDSIELVGIVTPPQSWKNNVTSYSVTTQVDDNNNIYVSLRGCGDKENENCSETKIYKINNKVTEEVSEIPIKTKNERKWSKECATNIRYKDQMANITLIKKDGRIFKINDVESNLR